MPAVFTADFETTTDPDDCRVWAWAVCEVANPDNIKYGNSIKSFMNWLSRGECSVAWFHNLGFDGKFIIDYLMRCGYEWVPEYPRCGEFTSLISNKGKFYQIEIHFMNGQRVIYQDSLKVFPMSVDKLGKTFNTPEQKGSIDYRAYREPGHKLTTEEIEYICHDVQIPAHALYQNFEQGLEKITIGANAFDFFKKQLGKKKFKAWFPTLSLEADADIRKSYRGGFTYVEPKYAGKVVGPGVSVDYNSMYPSVMKKYPYPCGVPILFEGEYEYDKQYPLYVQRMVVEFSLKEDGIPCIQLKGKGFYGQHEYVRETISPVEITVTSVDWEIMQRMYDIDVIEYAGGYKFQQRTGMFDAYIDYWGHVKETSTGGMRQLAKLMLNNLYGKFATNPDVTSKRPVMIDGTVHYVLGDAEYRDPVYLPVGTFCTAYARRELLFAIMDNRDRFVYCDTDSMHLLGTETPSGIPIDDKALCNWKVEGEFSRAKHLRTKAYIWDLNGKFSVTCAGMPDSVKELVTWDNFDYGFSNTDENGDIIPGHAKLMPKTVPGGVVLVDSVYRLHP